MIAFVSQQCNQRTHFLAFAAVVNVTIKDRQLSAHGDTSLNMDHDKHVSVAVFRADDVASSTLNFLIPRLVAPHWQITIRASERSLSGEKAAPRSNLFL